MFAIMAMHVMVDSNAFLVEEEANHKCHMSPICPAARKCQRYVNEQKPQLSPEQEYLASLNCFKESCDGKIECIKIRTFSSLSGAWSMLATCLAALAFDSASSAVISIVWSVALSVSQV